MIYRLDTLREEALLLSSLVRSGDQKATITSFATEPRAHFRVMNVVECGGGG
jgi:hypothetical protein